MYSPLLRRLAVAAILLLAGTLLLLHFTMTGMHVPDDARVRVLLLTAGAGLVGLLVAGFVAAGLSARIASIKGAAQQLLGGAGLDYSAGDDLAALERSLSGLGKELRASLDNLHYESARREAILSGMTEGVLAVDKDLRVTFCNQALLKAIGFRGTAGNPYEGFALLALVRDPALNELVRNVLQKGRPEKLRFTLSADIPRTFEVQVTPIDMPNGRNAIVIFHDITDLERLEQVRRDFVANVSHELRTPLAGIIGYSDTLLDGALDDTTNRRRFTEIIRANAVRLNDISSDLLTISELERHDGGEKEQISVRGVLDATLLTVEGEALARGVKLVRAEIEDTYVEGTRLRLEQALLNLVANAVKFNREGGEVRLSSAQKNGRVAIEISDTGVGIPSEDVPRIFERFYRVDKARSRQVGGTGLGLSIAKHVIERMSGSIMVESQLGKGTTFTILLPAAH